MELDKYIGIAHVVLRYWAPKFPKASLVQVVHVLKSARHVAVDWAAERDHVTLA
jgi:hypothetical protein